MNRKIVAIMIVVLLLFTAGCKTEDTLDADREQICSVEQLETEYMTLLEQAEHRLTNEDTASIELYTSAQIAPDGQMGWDSGDTWLLLVRQGDQVFPLYNEYVQYGEVQFWVSEQNGNDAENPKAEDLEHHIYVMATTGVGFTMYDYIWDAENSCFWKTVLLNPDHQWNTVHSNKYNVYAPPAAALTEAEIAEANAYFASIVRDEDETITQVRPVSCFFTSHYDDVSALNFEEFMRYFPGDGDKTPVSDAEFEALKTVECWPFQEVEEQDDMPVPIHKYSRSAVDAALMEYAGITTADLDTSAVAYLEEYDAYYNYTSDFGPGMFQCIQGEVAGDVVRLYSEHSVLTLEKADGHYWIVAFQPSNGR